MQKGCSQRGNSAPFPASPHGSLRWLQSGEWYPSARGLMPPARPPALHWESVREQGLTIMTHQTRPIQGLQGPSRVQPWTLYRTSHPKSLEDSGRTAG